MTLVIPLDIPRDGSDAVRSLLPFVRRRFEPAQWHLALLHLVPPPADLTPARTPVRPADGAPGRRTRSLLEAPAAALGGRYLERVAESELRSRAAAVEHQARRLRELGYGVRTEVRFGRVATEELARYVREIGADAVVLTGHDGPALAAAVGAPVFLADEPAPPGRGTRARAP